MRSFLKNNFILKFLSYGLLIVLMYVSIIAYSLQINSEKFDANYLLEVSDYDAEAEGKVLPFSDFAEALDTESFFYAKSQNQFLSNRIEYKTAHFCEIPTPPPDFLFLSLV